DDQSARLYSAPNENLPLFGWGAIGRLQRQPRRACTLHQGRFGCERESVSLPHCLSDYALWAKPARSEVSSWQGFLVCISSFASVRQVGGYRPSEVRWF